MDVENTQEQNAEELERSSVEAADNENQELEADANTQDSDVVDLDSLERFKWNGEEFTKDELGKMAMRQSDYTRKTQELAEERKYASNIGADLRTLAENDWNSDLVAKFKEVYPEKYHGVVDHFLNKSEQDQGKQPDEVESKVQKLFEERFSPHLKDLQSIKQEAYEQKVQAESKWLDNQFETMSKKYPLADDNLVNSELIAKIDEAKQNGQKFGVNEGVIEKLFKANHERMQKRFQEYQNNQTKEQANANKGAFDTGSGGGPVGEGRQKMGLREATENAINQLTKG